MKVVEHAIYVLGLCLSTMTSIKIQAICLLSHGTLIWENKEH